MTSTWLLVQGGGVLHVGIVRSRGGVVIAGDEPSAEQECRRWAFRTCTQRVIAFSTKGDVLQPAVQSDYFVVVHVRLLPCVLHNSSLVYICTHMCVRCTSSLLYFSGRLASPLHQCYHSVALVASKCRVLSQSGVVEHVSCYSE